MANLDPRESGRYITEHSQEVSIDDKKVDELAEKLFRHVKKNEIGLKNFKMHSLNPQVMDEAAIEWIFVCDLLNFSFWSDDPNQKFMVNYKGQGYTGYWSLCAALKRALDEGIPITSAHYYAEISREQLAHVFRSDSDGSMPMFEERLESLHQAGKCLIQKYDGQFLNCLKQCNQSAQQMIEIVARDFPSFEDVTVFNGQKVGIYKRLQILIADIWCCFEGQGLGTFHDIDRVTMFADYRIPQVLHYFDILKYSKSLLDKLNKGESFQSGDRDEVEIRGCSIWAVELLTMKIRERIKQDASMKDTVLNSVLLDHYLWDYRRDHAIEVDVVPFHRIRCIYY